MRIELNPFNIFARAVLACVIFFLNVTAQTKTPRQTASTGGTVIFAVTKYEKTGDEVQIEPVAIVSQGRYAPAPVASGDPQESPQIARDEKRFIADYLRPGRQYRLLFGGGEAGSLSVKEHLGEGCVSLTASATAQTQAKLGGEVLALATSSETLGRGKGTRRPPTEQERASALELARQAFKANRVSAARIAKMETNNLTAIDLDGDGRSELIGSFFIKGDAGVENALFLIAEPDGESLKAALSWYHYGVEEKVEFRRLVDALDLDADGVAEVIAGGSYYESNDYLIYKKTTGRWRVVYQGGGGGC